jgi:hypothetical protein
MICLNYSGNFRIVIQEDLVLSSRRIAMIENNVGVNQSVHIINPLDVWTQAALGSSSRVFLATLQNRQNLAEPAAVKVMHPGKREYALPLFIEEIKILKLINNFRGIVKMSEMGLIKFDNEKEFPRIETSKGCSALTEKVLRFDLDETINTDQLDDWVSLGWLPYVALAQKNYQQNLFMLCDLSRTPGHAPLDLKTGLNIAVQLCQIFSEVHEKNIVYFDHKIFHYYWYSSLSQAYVIDWNVGKLHTALTVDQKSFDIVQFSARVLYFIFTGRSAPGSLVSGQTHDEILNAPYKYETEWRYDDKRIPDPIKEIISAALNGEYTDFLNLKQDLMGCQRGENK